MTTACCVVLCCLVLCLLCPAVWLQVLAGLPNLQTLSLFTGREFQSDDFQPLTACRKLTSLSTDVILISPTTPQHGAAAAGTPGSADNDPVPSTQQAPADEARQGASLPAAVRAAAGSRWCLASLERLSIGNVGLAEYLAPLSTFAPHLTRLQDVSVAAAIGQLAVGWVGIAFRSTTTGCRMNPGDKCWDSCSC